MTPRRSTVSSPDCARRPRAPCSPPAAPGSPPRASTPTAARPRGPAAASSPPAPAACLLRAAPPPVPAPRKAPAPCGASTPPPHAASSRIACGRMPSLPLPASAFPLHLKVPPAAAKAQPLIRSPVSRSRSSAIQPAPVPSAAPRCVRFATFASPRCLASARQIWPLMRFWPPPKRPSPHAGPHTTPEPPPEPPRAACPPRRALPAAPAPPPAPPPDDASTPRPPAPCSPAVAKLLVVLPPPQGTYRLPPRPGRLQQVALLPAASAPAQARPPIRSLSGPTASRVQQQHRAILPLHAGPR